MKKRVLISLLTIGLSLHLTGCTSSDASKDQDDTSVATDDSFKEEGSGDFDDGSKTADAAPAEGNTDVAKTDDTGAATGGDMAAGGDAGAPAADGTAVAANGGGDELSLDGADPDKEFPDDVAGKGAPAVAANDAGAAPAAPTDQGLFDNPPAATQDASAPPAAPVEPPTATAAAPDAAPAPDAGMVASQPAPDTAAPATDLATNAGAGSDAPKKSFAPLQRVKDAPFEEKGANLNRYYVARAGDTTKNVSQKIYGSDRSKDLKAWNPTLKARSMKVGDKVYYNSPKDPQDTSKMMSFYEENGVAPQSYVTKEGDDLRDVSKKLLGDKNSWKEVWATNSNVESKGKVPAGVEVRYWPSGSDVASASPSAPAPNAKGNVASNDAAAGGAAGDGLSDVPPPPPTDMANNGAGGIPPASDNMNGGPTGAAGAAAAGAVAANGAPPPPGGPGADMNGGAPPPPQAAAPPPPPPPAAPAAMNKKPAQVADSTTSDSDQTMMLGAGGFLVLGGVLAFSVLRRKKASKARIDMTQTQV